jgi:hypothetical protein
VTRRRRGFALVHVLAVSLVIAAAAIVWRASFQALHAHAVRSPERARARALAQAGWERARAALAAGRSPAADGPLLDGRVTVTLRPVGAGRRVVVLAVVLRRDGEPLHARLTLDLDAAGRVVARAEGDA